MIDFVDYDGDGEINRDELCRVWTNRWWSNFGNDLVDILIE